MMNAYDDVTCTYMMHTQVIVLDAKGKKAKSAKGGGGGFGAKASSNNEDVIGASAVPEGTEVRASVKRDLLQGKRDL